MKRLRHRLLTVLATIIVMYVLQVVLVCQQAGQVSADLLILPLRHTLGIVSSQSLAAPSVSIIRTLHMQTPAGEPVTHVNMSLRPTSLSLAEAQANSLNVQGAIDIPALGIIAPLYDGGLSQGHMVIANGYSATHYRYSAAPGTLGNAVIYGHDDIEGSIFKHLGALTPGALITVMTADSDYVYRVRRVQVVDPGNVAVLLPTQTATLTLLTCTPFWVDTHRLVVTADLLEQPY